jgi:hypothetical protein
MAGKGLAVLAHRSLQEMIVKKEELCATTNKKDRHPRTGTGSSKQKKEAEASFPY